jgi:Ca2+-dependent lipid-binding protein
LITKFLYYRSTGQCDPYVRLQLKSRRPLQTNHTRMVEANRNPVYNEHFELRIFNEGEDRLELSVWDYDTLTAHDLLGKVQVPVNMVISSVEKAPGSCLTEWLRVGKEGELQVEYRYERVYDETGKPLSPEAQTANPIPQTPGPTP